MLGRALTSILWGIIADRYGRKPVVVIGTVTVLVDHCPILVLIKTLKFVFSFLYEKSTADLYSMHCLALVPIIGWL